MLSSREDYLTLWKLWAKRYVLVAFLSSICYLESNQPKKIRQQANSTRKELRKKECGSFRAGRCKSKVSDVFIRAVLSNDLTKRKVCVEEFKWKQDVYRCTGDVSWNCTLKIYITLLTIITPINEWNFFKKKWGCAHQWNLYCFFIFTLTLTM